MPSSPTKDLTEPLEWPPQLAWDTLEFLGGEGIVPDYHTGDWMLLRNGVHIATIRREWAEPIIAPGEEIG